MISAGSLSRMLQDAQECWNRQDYKQYFDIMARANRMDPGNHGLLLDLGAAHGKLYDYAAAEDYFERAARIAPAKMDALGMAGLHCRSFGRYEMAKRYFERATKEPGASADTFVKLAELYERFRCVEEANQLIDRALHLDPNCAMALLVRGRLERLSGRVDEAEKTIKSFLGKTDPNDWSTRIRGWYELGAILDRAGRYDEAMAAFFEAKNMIRPHATRLMATQLSAHARLKEAESDITAEVLRRWHENGRTLQPQRQIAVLCGHPRSGTTLLEQVLDSHPDIISAEETSVFFETYLGLKKEFPGDATMVSFLESASSERLGKARNEYFRAMELLLDTSINNRLLLDKNPSLTALVPAVARVFPEAKIVVALRDPRDICLSCFMQPLPMNQTSSMFLSIETTVQEYASLMSLWRTLAPRLPNPHLEVRYEDMVKDLEPVARRVLDFLGMSWNERVLRFNEFAREKLVRSPTYADVAKPIFKGGIGRWRKYQKHLEPWLDRLEPFIRAFGYE
jgi:tetratricopeptide (TPR) repeat protein